MDNLQKIHKLINWYHKNHTSNIDQLLKFQDKLSIRSYRLAEELAHYKQEYNFAYLSRKIQFNKAKDTFINKQGLSGTAADAKAETEITDIRQVETEAESTGYRLDILLKQINKILSACQQRISYLKQENELTRKQDTT